MNYEKIVSWIAGEILGETESKEDLDANIIIYMGSLRESVQATAEELIDQRS